MDYNHYQQSSMAFNINSIIVGAVSDSVTNYLTMSEGFVVRPNVRVIYYRSVQQLLSIIDEFGEELLC